MPRLPRIAIAVTAAALVPLSAAAQLRPAVSLSGGARVYDAHDGGESRVVASIRTEFPISDLLVLEFAGSVADRGDKVQVTTGSVFEAQLQLPLPLGPTLVPYFGVGAGAAKAYTRTVEDPEVELVLSGAIGVKAALSDNFGLVADARVRGVDWAFDASHFDLAVGVRYELGRPDRPRFHGNPRARPPRG
jgi:hypothetical protein